MMLVTGVLTVLFVLDWRLGVGMMVYLGIGAALLVSLRHRAVSESSDEMSAYARLYGGIEEKLTAIEDLRSTAPRCMRCGASSRTPRRRSTARCAASGGLSCGCGGR